MILDAILASAFSSYISSAASQAAGMPAAAAAQYAAGHERLTLSTPRFVTSFMRQEQPNPELGYMACQIELIIAVAAAGVSHAAVTDPETALAWMKALRSRLADDAALAAHLDTLTLAERTGWTALRHQMEPQFTIEDGAAEHERAYTQRSLFIVRLVAGA